MSAYNGVVDTERVRRSTLTRFNPISTLTPLTLTQQINSFYAGNIGPAARTWEAIRRRDDIHASVVTKRYKSISRYGWEIVAVDDSPEAEADKKALEYFYNNLQATSAINRNELGGVRLLIQQMMDATGKGLASHEMIMRPSVAGLTALFSFVPLWFFENTTGKLRYLPTDNATAGVPLVAGEWLVTAGARLMEASSIAYMYKVLSLKDWVIFNERNGMPGFIGRTSAAKGTTEWNNLVDAVNALSNDFAAVLNIGDGIEVLDLKGGNATPYAPLVERMDRATTAIWRGADLSTMSATGGGDSTGASIQADESSLLEDDDAEMISETLNEQVDRFVIQWYRGSNVPRAYFKLNRPDRRNITQDIATDTFLIESGVPVSVNDLNERYARPTPEEGEILAKRIVTTPGLGVGLPAKSATPSPFSNVNDTLRDADRIVTERLEKNGAAELAQGQADKLAAVRARINDVLAITNERQMVAEAIKLRAELPDLLQDMFKDDTTQKTIQGILTASLFNGAGLGLQEREPNV